MKCCKATFLALVVLPALSMARLHPHVKRQNSLIERAPDSLLESDCNQERSSTGDSPPATTHQRQPVQQLPPRKQNPPVTSSSPTGVYRGKPTKGGLLESNTKHPGFFIGSAVRASQLDGSMEACLGNLNLLVPEYEAKSDKIEPQANEWVSSPVDTILKYSLEHNMAFKLHTIFFDQTMAPYFQSLNGKPEALKAAMREHTQGIMKRYGDHSVMIDIVNEIMAYDGSGGMKKDLFYNTLGNEYLPFAFNTAKAASSHPLLSLNDNDVEGFHSKGLANKYEGLFRTVKNLKNKGVHVDVVSLESHFITGQVPKELPTVIRNFAALGVKVFISELDIKNDNGQDEQQGKDFAFVFDACLQNYPSCLGINMWGLTDRVNWNGEGSRATLFDANCKLKPIAEGVKAVLRGTKTFA